MSPDFRRIRSNMRYVAGIPRKPLPEGHVLVHNHVFAVWPLGTNGFRAWTQPVAEMPPVMVCPCSFAGRDLRGMTHYVPAGLTMGGRTDGSTYIGKALDHQARPAR